jgi:cytochrome P450
LFYEISKNLKVQQKLRVEIQKYFLDNQDISYQDVAFTTKLPYLNRVIMETLRMHIVGPFVDRVCVDPEGYSLEPYSDFRIPQGMLVLFPIYLMAFDETYFDDPWTFNPDRFKDKSCHGFSLPFGIGPRNCIGERLALLMLKVAVMHVLKDFKVAMNDKTPKQLTFRKTAFLLQYNELLYVDFVKDSLEINT